MRKYVLMTAAHNEEDYIEMTIKSVISQRILPMRWIIVSDNSTDNTEEIVRKYACEYEFISLRVQKNSKNNGPFSGKIKALEVAYAELKRLDFDFVGNLDADVSFGSDFYEKISEMFSFHPRLGICGGFIWESTGGEFKNRPTNDQNTVAGATQCFRRECYESINGYMHIFSGGEDTVANGMAILNGWDVEAFPELIVLHHKSGRNRRGLLKDCFRIGRADYLIGTDPIFEILKCFYHMTDHPIILSGLCRLVAFLSGYVRNEERLVPARLIKFFRFHQKLKLKNAIYRALFMLSRRLNIILNTTM